MVILHVVSRMIQPHSLEYGELWHSLQEGGFHVWEQEAEGQIRIAGNYSWDMSLCYPAVARQLDALERVGFDKARDLIAEIEVAIDTRFDFQGEHVPELVIDLGPGFVLWQGVGMNKFYLRLTVDSPASFEEAVKRLEATQMQLFRFAATGLLAYEALELLSIRGAREGVEKRLRAIYEVCSPLLLFPFQVEPTIP